MKLATRLGLAFGGVAAAPVLLAAPFVLHEVRSVFDAEYEARRTAAERSLVRERDALAAAVQASLGSLADSAAVAAIADDAARGADLRALHADAAPRLLASGGLDVLSLLDGDGVVLSSAHLPARAGDREPLVATLRAGAPLLALVEVRGAGGIERVPAIVALSHAEAAPTLLGGRRLGRAELRRFAEAADASVELLSPDGAVLLAATRPDAEAASVSRALEARVPLAGEAGAPFVLRARVDRAALAALERRILVVAGALLLAGAALAALAGALFARRITRPLEALADGAARLAAGELGSTVQVRADGEVGALVGSFNRMSEDLRRERERAAVAERVAAWQEVARRLAHEVKNPLTPIAMSIETLRDAHAQKSPLLDELFEPSARTILEEVARLKKIVDEFTRFARLPPPQLGDVELSDFARSVLSLYGQGGAGPTLARELEAGLPSVRADRDQLTQILVNLLQNAEQALVGRPGRIVVRTGRDGAAVFLELEDDGPGIPADQRETIFEPYVTSKATGTGLGLAIARRIAEEHGGRLELQPPGALGGARFRLTLPLR